MANYLITGGAGFIGSHFARFMVKQFPQDQCVILDNLTYAGNLSNIDDIQHDVIFVKGDVTDPECVHQVFHKHHINIVVHFAAETHVDRSIVSPENFIKTDVYGTYVLLEAAKKHRVDRFIQISTDEVYGSTEGCAFIETDPLMPSSPYSASKAGADRLAYSYFVTYGLPVIITRCSNNFGPYQFPEKLIPLFITRLLEDQNVPLYGDGKNVRDWIYVEDHVRAIDFLIHQGKLGEVYNIGGGNEKRNDEITSHILQTLEKPTTLIEFVKDRQGHDRRYALNSEKIIELGWKPVWTYEASMDATIQWYKEHSEWWKAVRKRL